VVDDQVILAIERLRDILADLKTALRKRFRDSNRQVTTVDIRTAIAKAAESWLTDLSARPGVSEAASAEYLADLAVRFQRILRFTEHSTQRGKYDAELNAILADITLDLIVPLKRLRSQESQAAPVLRRPPRERNAFRPAAFVGHSFLRSDGEVVQAVIDTLTGIGIAVVTGEVPRANRISEKVKALIEGQDLFVGIFTRRDKIARREEWTTSTWVIDEKAYAYARGKKLILLKEDGVGSIGGIQGDYEFLEFSRARLADLIGRLLRMFEFTPVALRS
jgi:hypothetical protein